MRRLAIGCTLALFAAGAVAQSTPFLLSCTDNSKQWSIQVMVDPEHHQLGIYTVATDDVAWMDFVESARLFKATRRGNPSGFEDFQINRYTLEFWYQLDWPERPEKVYRGKCTPSARVF